MIEEDTALLKQTIFLSVLKFFPQMLRDFEKHPNGACSILKADARVSQVVSAFQQKKNLPWFREMSEYGMSGSEITKKVSVLRCAERRSNSVVKSVDELTGLDREDTTGHKIIARLMTILVDASILTGPHGKSKYRFGYRLEGS